MKKNIITMVAIALAIVGLATALFNRNLQTVHYGEVSYKMVRFLDKKAQEFEREYPEFTAWTDAEEYWVPSYEKYELLKPQYSIVRYCTYNSEYGEVKTYCLFEVNSKGEYTMTINAIWDKEE